MIVEDSSDEVSAGCCEAVSDGCSDEVSDGSWEAVSDALSEVGTAVAATLKLLLTLAGSIQ